MVPDATTTTRPMEGGGGLSDSTTRPTKRARVLEPPRAAGGTNAPVPRRGPSSSVLSVVPTSGRFLKLHWKILQALYADNVVDNDDDKDGPLSQEWSDAIQNFLRDRGQVRSLESRTLHFQHLFDEAVDVLEQNQAQAQRWTPHSSFNVHHGSSWASRGTGEAPYSAAVAGRRVEGGGLSQPSPFPSTRQFSLMSSHHSGNSSNGALNEPIAAFGLLAGLLQAKVQQARGKLQTTTAPLEPLAAHLVERIETLEKQLAVIVGEGVEPPTSLHAAVETSESGDRNDLERIIPTPDECKERLARINTKLKLWKLLQSDLRQHP